MYIKNVYIYIFIYFYFFIKYNFLFIIKILFNFSFCPAYKKGYYWKDYYQIITRSDMPISVCSSKT